MKRETPMANATYALAIRKTCPPEYGTSFIIIKRGMSMQDARNKAEDFNRHKMPECKALGGECFVAYNLEAV